MGEGKTEECQNQIRQLFLETAQSLPGTEEERFMTVKIFACVYFLRLEEELGKIAERDLQKNFAFWKEFQQIEKMEDIFLWAGEEIRRLYEAFSAEEKKSDSRICRVFLYLMKNYAKDISLEEISDSIRVSPFYLTRLLKHQMNTTFVEMLTDIRIRKAVLLLEEGQKSVREIGAWWAIQIRVIFIRSLKRQPGLLWEISENICPKSFFRCLRKRKNVGDSRALRDKLKKTAVKKEKDSSDKKQGDMEERK